MYFGDVFYQSLLAGVVIRELGKNFFFENAHTIWDKSSGREHESAFGNVDGTETPGKGVEFF